MEEIIEELSTELDTKIVRNNQLYWIQNDLNWEKLRNELHSQLYIEIGVDLNSKLENIFHKKN